MRLFCLASIMCVAAGSCLAQTTTNPLDVGLQPFHDYSGSGIDHVNLDNGNLTLTIPIVSYPQRGDSLKVAFALVYNGNGLNYVLNQCTDATTSGGQVLSQTCMDYWKSTNIENPFLTSGGPALLDTQDLALGERNNAVAATIYGYVNPFYPQTEWYTPDGATHSAGQTSTGQISLDGSSIQAGFLWPEQVDATTPTCTWDCTFTGVLAPHSSSSSNEPNIVGTQDGVTFLGTSSSSIGPIRVDADGNYISSTSTGYEDTVGRSIPMPSPVSSPTAAQLSSCAGSLPIVSVSTWQPPGYTQPFLFCYAKITVSTPAQIITTIPGHPGSTTRQEGNTSRTVLQNLVLPNGQEWTFGYTEQISANCPLSYVGVTDVGDLTHITFPTGGTIDYTYGCLASWTPTTTTTGVVSRTVNANDGNGPLTWTYSYSVSGYNGPSIVTETDPQMNQTVQTLTLGQSGVNATRVVQTYSGSSTGGTLLKTDTRSYPYQYAAAGSFPLYPATEMTTLSSGLSTQTSYQYCCDLTYWKPGVSASVYPNAASYGKVTSTAVYDFASGTQGQLLSTTTTGYVFQNSADSAYLNPGFFDLKASSTVLNGSGTQVASSSYVYDAGTPSASGTTTQFAYPIYGVRGHLSSSTEWLNAGGSSPQTSAGYWDTGEVHTKTDANQNTTTFTYGSAYAGALPTAVTNALSQTTTYAYDPNFGLKTAQTDPNSKTTSWTYDGLGRTTKISQPDQSYATICYDDVADFCTSSSPLNSVVVTESINATTNLQEEEDVDGLGRKTLTRLLSDPEGVLYTRTAYDSLGRVSQVWNPTRCNPLNQTSCSSEATFGSTATVYDALNRKILQTQPDGNTLQWCYDGAPSSSAQTICLGNKSTHSNGSWVDSVDEAGRHAQHVSDAMGRLVAVMEPGASSNTPSLETDYVYDPLKNLLSVDQIGASGETPRLRSFTYDSLSRLLCASNPENSSTSCPSSASASIPSGVVSYSYDANSNVLKKTDARAISTSFVYDALNRVTSKSYTDGTPGANYTYDAWSSGSTAPLNPIGRLVEEHTAVAGKLQQQELFSYDSVGRVASIQSCGPAECGSTSYTTSTTYDLAGHPTTVVYPDHLSITESYDAAGRLTSIAPTTALTSPYMTVNSYLPSGAPQSISYGNGVTETLNQNDRLQPCESKAVLPGTVGGTAFPSQSIMDRQYFYTPATSTLCGAQGSNNGNIFSVLDGVLASGQTSSPYSQSFSYDYLNRITNWNTAAMAGKAQQQTFNYDSFGNINQTNDNPPTAGTADPLTSPAVYNASSWLYDGNNHLLPKATNCIPNTSPYWGSTNTVNSSYAGTAYIYDLAGNTLCSGVNGTAKAYVWDADSRISQVWAEQNNNAYAEQAFYTYDAQGDRVRADQMTNPATYREYVYSGGEMLSEHDQTGVFTDYLFANGKKIARVMRGDTHIAFAGNATNTSSWSSETLSTTPVGYVIRTGDKLYWRQYESSTARGGLVLATSGPNGTCTCWNELDQDGQMSNDDSLSGKWHQRVIKLDRLAGSPVYQVNFNGDQNSTGSWTINFADISLVSADGSVITLYNGESYGQNAGQNLGANGFVSTFEGDSGDSITENMVTSTPVTGTPNSVYYYLGDQLGTTQMELSMDGWPVWQGQFAPFGQQLDTNLTSMRFKFTGKERDAESGLDYFGARYYASGTGRWMSPDWSAKAEAVPYAKLDSPQSLNLYAYVDNNPIRSVDADGHDDVEVGGNNLVAAKGNAMLLGLDPSTVTQVGGTGGSSSGGTAQQQTTPLTNRSGNVVQGANGNPALIPGGFDVNAVVQAGKDDKYMRSVAPMVGSADTASDLANFRRYGKWDLQRLSGNFDSRFIDSATILIGMYAAAAGLPRDQILSIENKVAIGSTYAKGTVFDSTYTHLPVRNVTNTDIGMRLVQSGSYVP